MNDELFRYWGRRGYRPGGVPHDLGTRRVGYHSLGSSRSSSLRCPWLPRWRAPDRRGVQRRAPQDSVPESHCRICGGSRMISNSVQTTDTGVRPLSSTSSTSGGFAKVDEKTDTRRPGRPFSSTSSTSFSKEGVMWGRVPARPPARLQPSPIRETGRRSRREWHRSVQSCDFVVYFGVFSEVDGGRQ